MSSPITAPAPAYTPNLDPVGSCDWEPITNPATAHSSNTLESELVDLLVEESETEVAASSPRDPETQSVLPVSLLTESWSFDGSL